MADTSQLPSGVRMALALERLAKVFEDLLQLLKEEKEKDQTRDDSR